MNHSRIESLQVLLTYDFWLLTWIVTIYFLFDCPCLTLLHSVHPTGDGYLNVFQAGGMWTLLKSHFTCQRCVNTQTYTRKGKIFYFMWRYFNVLKIIFKGHLPAMKLINIFSILHLFWELEATSASIICQMLPQKMQIYSEFSRAIVCFAGVTDQIYQTH